MKLKIQLRSDSAFGRGDGIAGLVNSEVEHDALTGLPFIKGRTVKGLLVEACADLLYALQANPAYTDTNNKTYAEMYTKFEKSAEKLFGKPGSTLDEMGCLHVSAAKLPDDLRQHLAATRKYTPQQVLQAFTAIRHQTAVDAASDTPKDGSLRSIRVVVRNTVFYAEMQTNQPLAEVDYELLAACAAGAKRGGQNRTRGLGWIEMSVDTQGEYQGNPLDNFIKNIGGNS